MNNIIEMKNQFCLNLIIEESHHMLNNKRKYNLLDHKITLRMDFINEFIIYINFYIYLYIFPIYSIIYNFILS